MDPGGRFLRNLADRESAIEAPEVCGITADYDPPAHLAGLFAARAHAANVTGNRRPGLATPCHSRVTIRRNALWKKVTHTHHSF